MSEVPLDGVSPETLRDIHSDEVRLLRSQAMSAAGMSVLLGGAWIASELTSPGAAMPFLFGYLTVTSLFKTGTAVRRWWALRLRDPVVAAADAEGARTRAIAAAAEQAARFAAHPAYATWTIAAALIVVALLEFLVVGSVPRAVAAAGLDKARVAAGEWWRLFTAAFLHGSVWHFWANITALAVFGRIIEAYSTRSRLLLAYLTAVIAGHLASWWLLPHATSIGASGGILGLVGFVYALRVRRPRDVPESYGRAALWTMLLTGAIGAVGYRFIDNAAHAGGALAGFLVGWLTVPRELTRAESSPARYQDERVVSMMGALTGVVLTAAAVFSAATVFGERSRGVTSLRVDLVARGNGQFDVQLENLKDVPLEAYTLDVYDSKVLVYRQWRDERGFADATIDRAAGPLAPHERRVVPLGDSRTSVGHPSVRVVAAAFKDGTFEGSATEHDMLDERRANVAADAIYWIGVIDDALTRPPDQAAAIIDAKIGERAKANAAARHSSYMFGMGSLLRTAVHAPERFASDARAERARLVQSRDELSSTVR